MGLTKIFCCQFYLQFFIVLILLVHKSRFQEDVREDGINGREGIRKKYICDQECQNNERNELLKLYNATQGKNWIYGENERPWDTYHNCTIYGQAMPAHCCWQGVCCCAPYLSREQVILSDYIEYCQETFIPELFTLPLHFAYMENIELEAFYNETDDFLELMNEKNSSYNYKWTDEPDGSCQKYLSVNKLRLPRMYLKGQFPDLDLESLSEIIVSQNFISGSIPKSIFSLKYLVELRMNQNLLNGTIPSSISQMEFLRNVDLQNNDISGTIPQGFLYNGQNRSNIGIQSVRLGFNQLTGEIPLIHREIYYPPHLELQYNRLSGRFPITQDLNYTEEQYGNYINHLDIRGNSLSGSFPNFIGTFIQGLEYLDIGQNQFNGSLPSSLQKMMDLETLAVDDNQFTGKIPSLDKLQNLREFYLGYNDFTSTIPRSLLETGVVDPNLERNNIYGRRLRQTCKYDYVDSSCKVKGDPNDLIMGSGVTQAHVNEYPFLVSLQKVLEYPSNSSGGCFQHFCGGTMISKNLVLTAAHCFDDLIGYNTTFGEPFENIFVSHNPKCRHQGNPSFKRTPIQYIYIPQEYNRRNLNADIAIVSLLGDYYGITVDLNLQQGDFEMFEEFNVAGYGYTRPDEKWAFMVFPLQETKLRYIDNDICHQELKFHGAKNPYLNYTSMFCAINSVGDTCEGDSGGPLLLRHSNDFKQVGIVSWGPPSQCISSNAGQAPGVFTRIFPFASWIQSVIQQHSGKENSQTDNLAEKANDYNNYTHFIEEESHPGNMFKPQNIPVCTDANHNQRKNTKTGPCGTTTDVVDDVSCFPASSVGMIEIISLTTTIRCTGTMISKDVVATSVSWLMPFIGQLTPILSAKFYPSMKKFQGFAITMDLGGMVSLLKLAEPVGYETGWMGMYNATSVFVQLTPKVAMIGRGYEDFLYQDCELTRSSQNGGLMSNCNIKEGLMFQGAPVYDQYKMQIMYFNSDYETQCQHTPNIISQELMTAIKTQLQNM